MKIFHYINYFYYNIIIFSLNLFNKINKKKIVDKKREKEDWGQYVEIDT